MDSNVLSLYLDHLTQVPGTQQLLTLLINNSRESSYPSLFIICLLRASHRSLDLEPPLGTFRLLPLPRAPTQNATADRVSLWPTLSTRQPPFAPGNNPCTLFLKPPKQIRRALFPGTLVTSSLLYHCWARKCLDLMLRDSACHA